MRLDGRSGIARAIYVTAVGKRVVVVHVFEKKTEKTPQQEIAIECFASAGVSKINASLRPG